jgi:hypothetical protein
LLRINFDNTVIMSFYSFIFYNFNSIELTLILIDLAKYWTNPQFLVRLMDVDENDNENKATVIFKIFIHIHKRTLHHSCSSIQNELFLKIQIKI